MTEAPTPPQQSPQAKVIQMLMDRLADAKAGKISAIVVGYLTTEGAAAVESSPMSPIMLNHLTTMLCGRRDRAYERAAAQESAAPNPGVGKVPTSGKPTLPPPNPALPRNVRRNIAKQIKKAAKASPKSASPANGSSVPAALKPS